jgi:hypothetical protein
MIRYGAPLFVGVAIVVMTAAGCNDARWKEVGAVRRARIAAELKRYSDREAAGPERIKETMEIDRRLAEHSAENLEWTTELIRRSHERDVRRWHDEAPDREAMLRGQWNGHPETIPDTWARMVY